MPARRLIGSRTFWEILVAAILIFTIVINLHRLDHWRGLVRSADVAQQLHGLHEELKQGDQRIKELKARDAAHVAELAELQTELLLVKSRRPELAPVLSRLKETTITDEGLVAETQRVLPDLRIRLARVCR